MILPTRKTWFRIAGVIGLAFLISIGGIAYDGLHDRIQDPDLAIVLGTTVETSGRPSARLQARLDKSLELIRSGQCKAIWVSGGIGSEGFDEALVMKQYLVAKGVQPELVFTDSQGTNTFETARNASKLIREMGFRRPIVVSQFFHLTRCRLAFRKNGVPLISTAHAAYFEPRDLYSIVREVFGCISYGLRSCDRPGVTADAGRDHP